MQWATGTPTAMRWAVAGKEYIPAGEGSDFVGSVPVGETGIVYAERRQQAAD